MAREYSNRVMWELFIVQSRSLLGLSIKCPSTPKKWAPCSYWNQEKLTRRIIGVSRSISTFFETIKSKLVTGCAFKGAPTSFLAFACYVPQWMEAKHVSPIKSGARAQQNNNFDNIAHEANANPLVAMTRQSLLTDIYFHSHACFPLLHFGSTSPTIRIGLPSSMSSSSYLTFLLDAML